MVATNVANPALSIALCGAAAWQLSAKAAPRYQPNLHLAGRLGEPPNGLPSGFGLWRAPTGSRPLTAGARQPLRGPPPLGRLVAPWQSGPDTASPPLEGRIKFLWRA